MYGECCLGNDFYLNIKIIVFGLGMVCFSLKIVFICMKEIYLIGLKECI